MSYVMYLQKDITVRGQDCVIPVFVMPPCSLIQNAIYRSCKKGWILHHVEMIIYFLKELKSF